MKELSPAAAEIRDLFEDTLGRIRSSPGAVAKQIGISHRTLSGFLRAEAEPLKSTLAKVKDWCDAALTHVRAREMTKPLDRLHPHPCMDTRRDGREWKRRPR